MSWWNEIKDDYKTCETFIKDEILYSLPENLILAFQNLVLISDMSKKLTNCADHLRHWLSSVYILNMLLCVTNKNGPQM